MSLPTTLFQSFMGNGIAARAPAMLATKANTFRTLPHPSVAVCRLWLSHWLSNAKRKPSAAMTLGFLVWWAGWGSNPRHSD